MENICVNANGIVSIGYNTSANVLDSSSEILEVGYSDGEVWRYEGFPKKKWEELKANPRLDDVFGVKEMRYIPRAEILEVCLADGMIYQYNIPKARWIQMQRSITPKNFFGIDVNHYAYRGYRVVGDFGISNNILLRYLGSGGEVIIPNGVTAINARAFKGYGVNECRDNISAIKIPEGIVEIAEGTFQGLKYLEYVDLPETIETVGKKAFESCIRLKHVILRENCTRLGDKAFYGCLRLEDLQLPSGIVAIGDECFAECQSLSRISIPRRCNIIGTSAFACCQRLREVMLSDSISNIGDYAFEECIDLRMIEIPGSCKEIGKGAFKGCRSLSKVRFLKGIKSIGASAFENCISIHSITLPDGITELKHKTFSGCIELGEVYLPDSVVKISETVFVQTNITQIHAPKGSYAEGFFLEQIVDAPSERKQRKFQEWRKYFQFSMRANGVYIKRYLADSKIVYIPDHFGKSEIGEFDQLCFPSGTVVLCSQTVFRLLPIDTKYSTVVSCLRGRDGFSDEEREYLLRYAKKNQSTMMEVFTKRGDTDALKVLQDVTHANQ